MNFENPNAPRLRIGEVMPPNPYPDRKVPTRFSDGEIVFISRRIPGEPLADNSLYTEVQLLELEGIRIAKAYLIKVQGGVNEDTRGGSRNTLDTTEVDVSNMLLDYLDYNDFEPEL